MVDSNNEIHLSSNSRRVLVFALVVEIGIAGATLTGFIMAMDRNGTYANAYIGAAGLCVWAFAVHGYFGWSKRVFVLLGPPGINLLLFLGLAVFWPFLHLVYVLFRPICWIGGAFVAGAIAHEFVCFIRIVPGKRRTYLALAFTAIIFLFEASAVLACQPFCQWVFALLETFGVDVDGAIWPEWP